MPEVMAHDLEGSGRVAERAGDLGGGALLDEVSAQGFVLALLCRGGLEEESSRIAYVYWLSDRHVTNLVHRKAMSRYSGENVDGCRPRGPLFIGEMRDRVEISLGEIGRHLQWRAEEIEREIHA